MALHSKSLARFWQSRLLLGINSGCHLCSSFHFSISDAVIDSLGSVASVTNAAGSILERYEYDPYGKPTMFNASNVTITASAIGNPILFTGRWLDAESGLYDYRARAYSSSTGRFLQRDPIGYEDGMNLYKYALNNPMKYTDPTGNFAWLAIPLWELALYGGVAYAGWKASTGGFQFPDDISWNLPWMPPFPLTNGGKICLLRGKNPVPDQGPSGTVATNGPGTTKKLYGPDGWVTKEWNKGHPDSKHPKGSLGNEDHVHDYKPNPHNPSGRPDRQPARKPTPQDDKDFGNS